MTDDERAAHNERASRGRRYGAMVRHIDRVRNDLTDEQRRDLAYYLAPELLPPAAAGA